MPDGKNESFGGKRLHDFSEWQPDIVVINLGTNDEASFNQPEWTDEKTGEHHKMRKNADGSYCEEDIAAFERAVADFLYTLRECNPKAHIIWCYGMLGIAFQMPILEGILMYQKASRDSKVSYLQLPGTNDTNVGSRQHPGALCHKQAAEVLVNYIRQLC